MVGISIQGLKGKEKGKKERDVWHFVYVCVCVYIYIIIICVYFFPRKKQLNNKKKKKKKKESLLQSFTFNAWWGRRSIWEWVNWSCGGRRAQTCSGTSYGFTLIVAHGFKVLPDIVFTFVRVRQILNHFGNRVLTKPKEIRANRVVTIIHVSDCKCSTTNQTLAKEYVYPVLSIYITSSLQSSRLL